MNNNNTEAIKNYFNEDIRKAIRDMSNSDMNQLLQNLEGTAVWIAVLKYVQDRSAVVQDSLLSLDPLKEASKISQYQGMVSGFWDIPDAVLSLKFASKKAEDPKYQEDKMKDEKGGAYGAY